MKLVIVSNVSHLNVAFFIGEFILEANKAQWISLKSRSNKINEKLSWLFELILRSAENGLNQAHTYKFLDKEDVEYLIYLGYKVESTKSCHIITW